MSGYVVHTVLLVLDKCRLRLEKRPIHSLDDINNRWKFVVYKEQDDKTDDAEMGGSANIGLFHCRLDLKWLDTLTLLINFAGILS